MTRIILDIGSTHGSNLNYLRQAIDFCVSNGCELKVQLFSQDHPAAANNLVMDHDVFASAWEYSKNPAILGYPCNFHASVFDEKSYQFYKSFKPRTIKFAHSMCNSTLIDRALEDRFPEVIVSRDYIDNMSGRTVNLLCIPQYPVLYKLDIQPEWFTRFHGFSDHTLGIDQTRAMIEAGAQVIEKHVRFRDYEDCPDARFAIDERQAKWLALYAHV